MVYSIFWSDSIITRAPRGDKIVHKANQKKSKKKQKRLEMKKKQAKQKQNFKLTILM